MLLNIGGAIVGGVAGASGAAYSAVISGKEGVDVFKAAAIGSGAGLVSGALLNPNGIVGAMAAGSFSGATGSGAAEYVLNDNANFTSITNAAIEGVIVGSLVSGSTFLFTPVGSGVAGKAIGAMTSAPIDFTLSTISNKYDLIKKINRVMENFYATNYTNRKRYYLPFLLLASFYLCISFAFLADILFPNLFGIKSFSEFIFNIDLFVVIAILVTIAQVCFYVTTNFYVKKISSYQFR